MDFFIDIFLGHAKIGIQCQAWAKNIMYQKFSSSGLGFVKFQLTVN